MKTKNGLGGNIPLDLQLEFYNRMMKAAVKNVGPNASKTSLNRYRPLAHDVTAPVMMHLEDKLAIYA